LLRRLAELWSDKPPSGVLVATYRPAGPVPKA